MIHTKLLIRRLAYVPWLLAAGLVLGWAGEAAAVEVTLTVDKSEVREDAGETDITAKATVAADATADIAVVLRLEDQTALNSRFRIRLPTITIPKGAKEATGTITFEPIDDGLRGDDVKNDGDADDLVITIKGSAGSHRIVKDPTITLLDNDKLSTDLDLSFSPGDLSNEAGLTNVTVTATLNGSLSGIDHSLLLLFNNPADVDVADLPSNISSTDEILRRDSDYSASPATIDLRRKHASGKATITIDPKETRDADAYIVLHTELDSLKGIDLNLDGDTGDSIVLTRADTTDADGNVLTGGNNVPPTDPNEVDTRRVRWSLREEALGCDAAGHRFNLVSSPGDTVPCDDFLSEDDLGIDLNGKNGVETAEHLFNMRIDSTASLKEADLKFAITANLGFFKIKNAPLLRTKEGDAGLVASPKTIREEDGRTEIELKVVLEAASTSDASVRFTIESNTDDLPGVRDVDYTVAVDDLIIPAGATEGTTTLTLTPTNNSDADGAKSFIVEAQVGADDTTVGFETITITDDETLTENITLSVSPGELKAGTGANVVTVTGTLDGQVFDEDVNVVLVITRNIDTGNDKVVDDGTAQRDTDYTAILRSLTIPAGEVKGSTTVSITPLAGGDKKVGLTALKSPVTNADDEKVAVSTVSVVLKDADPDAEVPDPGALSFGAVDLSSTVFEYTAGTAIDPEELPEAEGGTGALTYAVSKLPAGLSFDAATRTISGTPTTAGSSSIVYTVIDSDPAGASSSAMAFTIEIGAAPVPTVGFASLASTHSSVRENGEMTVITLTATLASASDIDETVSFTIGAPSAGALAVRDVDYTAALGGVVTIAAGETQGTTTLILTPLDNAAVDGNKYLGVQVSASGGSAQTDIKIADDETPSTTISLSVSPHTISEAAGLTEVTITATLDGKVLGEAATVSVSIDGGSVATRDVDYSALFNPLLRIEAGSTSGSIALLIDPTADGEDEGNETITLNGAIAGLIGGSADITLSDAEVVAPEPEPTPLAFADGASVADVMSTAGTAIGPIELPAVLDGTGEGDVSYSVSELPAGLEFDAATRTLSGEPAEVSEKTVVEVTYTATDGADATASLTFSITVNPMLDFGDLGALFGAFNGGAGKANPASEHDRVIPFVFGQAVDLVLPEVSGGTPPLTYSVSGLPAGLSFDAATRTISGTPTELIVAAVVTYTVTDGSGASNSLPFLVAVIEPPLDAPDALVAEDYKGADGAGDQGGFVLLTWDLSEHHDGIDGYRIFRELPVLNNEMVPWAMVDAVPGVQIGRAIVATLDNVATNWGIAAERGNQTTHGAAKAAFVRAENLNQPYELMAETLLASREAAQAGDAPVFASLLPEALAFAQGVAPKLNSVEGVLESSAITVTEEPVRAIDNIAPEAVPSLRVLDAPNDEGSRIVLTWTLSPSDRLLQGVVAEAIGPATTEPVVGVRGYGIYRRAAGEDEFVLVAQVDAGVASFVDATALNGVRYTYQVRPYDADNETGSELEQTALAVRNRVVDSEGRAFFGLFGADNRVGFDDFFIFADHFGLTAEDVGFDPAFDLAPSAAIDFDDFFVFADHFGRSTAAAGKRVPLFAGLNAEARLYVDARTALPSVGEDFVLDVRMADFVAVKGYGLQVQYDADKLEFVEALTDQPLGGSALAAPQVLSDDAGVLALVAHGAVVSDGEVGLSLVFRPTTEIESTVIEITDSQTYDSVGFNRLVLPAPVALQTRPAVFALANNYPNPFNPATTIRYALPQAADVELTVYNVVGQAVRTLVAEHQSAGRYVVEWDATNESGHSLSSGLYFYHLQAGGEFREVKKMLLLK